MQNEMIKIMVFQILRNLVASLHTKPFYIIMADKTTDVSNYEQVVVGFRWVSDTFEIHEEFIGLHVVESIDANTVVSVIKIFFLRLNLSLNKVRGWCYDGAATMAGLKSRVAK